MPWYIWLFLGAGALFSVLSISLRLLRLSARGRAFMALGTRAKLRFARLLLADRQVPLIAKAVLVVVVGYLAMPFDLIPDFIPVLGQADDVLVVIGAVALLLLLVPRQRFNAALERARQESSPDSPAEGPGRILRSQADVPE
jgi:uncharacterized membrane protein YkvA (DUF1232 family)